MKFKDKDGHVYESVFKALEAWCPAEGLGNRSICDTCKMARVAGDNSCVEYAEGDPRLAAKIMGYEVIEDGEDINVPAKKDGNQPYICEKCVWEDTVECADCKNLDKFRLGSPSDCDETPKTCINWGMADLSRQVKRRTSP